MKTIRQRVLRTLALAEMEDLKAGMEFPTFTGVRTAVQIRSCLKDVKLSSLSSVLNRLVKDKTLERIQDWGPRGGYGYFY